MEAIFESTNKNGGGYFTLHRYQNLVNLPHYHSEHELIHIDKGTAEISINNVLYVLHDGKSVFAFANDIHNIKSDCHTIISVIKVDTNYFGDLFSGRRLISPVLSDRYFSSNMLDSIRNELKHEDKYGTIIALNTLSTAFAKMLRHETTREAKKDISNTVIFKNYNKIIELISRDYATLTFSDAAEHMGFTKPYFSKLFYQMFGMTFTEYLNTVRIGIAIKMLREKQISITEIAYSCGFNTIRSFNRTFKDATGYTPSSLPGDYVYPYRIKQTEGIDPTLNCTIVLE